MRFLTKKEVRYLSTLSPTEIARREARGAFPKRVPLSEYPKGRVAWRDTDLAEWMADPTGYRQPPDGEA